MLNSHVYPRTIHKEDAECGCFSQIRSKEYFLSSKKSLDSRLGYHPNVSQQISMLKGDNKVSLKKISPKNRPCSPQMFPASARLDMSIDKVIAKRYQHQEMLAKTGQPGAPVHKKYAETLRSVTANRPYLQASRNISINGSSPSNLETRNPLGFQTRNEFNSQGLGAAHRQPPVSLAELKQKVELPLAHPLSILKTHRSVSPSQLVTSRKNDQIRRRLPSDQGLASSRQREDTIFPIEKEEEREYPRKGDRPDMYETVEGIFGSNIENRTDSLLINRPSKVSRPMLKKIADVHEIQSVKDSSSDSSEESIVLGRANTNSIKIEWGNGGGSMLNLSKSISSPTLKSKLMSVETHQSSVGKSFFQSKSSPRNKKGLF